MAEEIKKVAEQTGPLDTEESGRCRLYYSSDYDNPAKCINAESEDECARYARNNSYDAYGWAPGYSC